MESFISPESIDLIITGPPYWNEVVYSSDKAQLSAIDSYKKFLEEIRKVWQQSSKILKSGGILAFWSHDLIRDYGDGPMHIPLHHHLCDLITDPLIHRTTFAWDRYLVPLHNPNGMPTSGRLVLVSIFQKKIEGDYPYSKEMRELLWRPVLKTKTHPSLFGFKTFYRIAYEVFRAFQKPMPLLRSLFRKFKNDPYQFQNYITECPPEIAEFLIRKFSKQNDTVLDPFAGSGTTLAVARNLQRNAIGVEISKEAINAINRKLRN